MSTVIKALGPARTGDGMSFNLEDMAAKAKDYLDGVRRQAAEILNQATQEAERIRRHAEHQGQQAAIRAVERVMEEKVGRQIASLLPALRAAVESLRDSRQEWLEHWEKTGLHVAAQLAERVLRKELIRQPEAPLALVREALELAAGSAEVQVRLHPADFATLGTQVAQLSAELSRAGEARIVADPEIAPGGCRVLTRHGSLDQQFHVQLARIEEELT